MLDLPTLIRQNSAQLLGMLEPLPDAATLLERLVAVFRGTPPAPWFPLVGSEALLSALSRLEDGILPLMSWRTEPDPVSRAHARAQLRQALNLLTREHAAYLDRELESIRHREQQLQQQLERQRALSEALLATRHAGVVVLDGMGRVMHWGEGTTALTGRCAADMIHRSILEVLPELRPAVVQMQERLSQRPKGELLPLEGRCALVHAPGQELRKYAYRLGALRGAANHGHESQVLSLWDDSEIEALREQTQRGSIFGEG